MIEAVGPGGNFLSVDHTLKDFKKEIWISQMLDRKDYLGWQAEGGKTLKDRAGQKVRWILENHKPPPLPDSVQKRVKLIVRGVDERRKKAIFGFLRLETDLFVSGLC